MVVPLVALSIVTFGWRATAIGSGLLAIVVGLPLAGQFRGRPEDLGQTIDGLPPAPPRDAGLRAGTVAGDAGSATAGAAPQSSDATAAGLPSSDAAAGPPRAAAAAAAPADSERTADPREFTLREALRTRAFWLVSAGHGAALLVVTAVNVHAITHMKESLGYSVSQASLVITLMTLAQIGGVLLGIAYGDRYPKRLIAAWCMGMHAVGLLSLTYASGPAMLAFFRDRFFCCDFLVSCEEDQCMTPA